MSALWREATRNAVYATRAAVTLTAKPGIDAMPLSPALRSTATTPKHVADVAGRTRRDGRTPAPPPPTERSDLPATMPTVPNGTASGRRAPRRRTAAPHATRGDQ